jgi:tRNA U34 2-thiouridine synthase MnmA/TrmU
VTIGSRSELLVDRVAMHDARWVDQEPRRGSTVQVQTRAHGAPSLGVHRGSVVELAAPIRRVAPGQVVALYDGDALLGGAIAA